MRSSQIPPPVETIELGGTTVSYVVRRSPRAKYMRITISPHNGVVVTLPARLKRYINPEQLLREKESWVLQHVAKAAIPPPPAPMSDGSKVNYQGREYNVRRVFGGSWLDVKIAANELQVFLPADFDGELKEVVRTWIKNQALETIVQEAARAAAMIGVRYNRVTVRDQKTKWGSCSKKGNLSFNWRLILFPPQVLRYVVIHELCHIKHFNHSPRFWNLVERYDPSYEESIAWLKQNSAHMEGDLR
jgi:predicted metal-dependent hydrolase